MFLDFMSNFNGESFYDVPTLTVDPRFRDSMRLITHYSLLPFMTPRKFYYPWVVLQFYHSMTSRGAPSPLELRFTIDDRLGVLQVATSQLHWACQQSRLILEGIEIGHSRHSGRWSAVLLEIPRKDQYFSGGSSRLRCFSLITCSGPPYSRYNTTSSAGEPYSRPCTESQRDSGSVPLSWS